MAHYPLTNHEINPRWLSLIAVKCGYTDYLRYIINCIQTTNIRINMPEHTVLKSYIPVYNTLLC